MKSDQFFTKLIACIQHQVLRVNRKHVTYITITMRKSVRPFRVTGLLCHQGFSDAFLCHQRFFDPFKGCRRRSMTWHALTHKRVNSFMNKSILQIDSNYILVKMLFGQLEKYGLFSKLQYGFRSSWSTVDLLAFASALNISKAFDRVWHAGLLHKLNPYGILGQVSCLNLSFRSNRRLSEVLGGKSLQEYQVNAAVGQGNITGATLFLMYINELPAVICNIAIYADDTTLYSKCEQPSDLWSDLELATQL